MTTLDYALEYIARSWSVFPLKPRSKEPACTLGPLLSGAQRYSEEDARATWLEHTDYGIGIVCGAPSSLVVCDVDVRNGGDVEKVRAMLPSYSYEVATGGGGAHFYLCVENAGTIRKGKSSIPGVDRIAQGGYVVCPPSWHPSGQQYRWVNAVR